MAQLTAEWIQKQLNMTPDQVRAEIAPSHDDEVLWISCYSDDDWDTDPEADFAVAHQGKDIWTMAEHSRDEGEVVFNSRREAEDYLIVIYYEFWLRRQREFAQERQP